LRAEKFKLVFGRVVGRKEKGGKEKEIPAATKSLMLKSWLLATWKLPGDLSKKKEKGGKKKNGGDKRKGKIPRKIGSAIALI